jgi:hypothetical protein
MAVDSEWFKSQVLKTGRSLRGFAREVLDLDPAQFQRALSGRRELRAEDLARLSAEFHVPMREIYRRAGVTAALPPRIAAKVRWGR